MTLQKAKDELQKYLQPWFVDELEISTWDDFCNTERWKRPRILDDCCKALEKKEHLKLLGQRFITDADLLEEFVRDFTPGLQFDFLFETVNNICELFEHFKPQMQYNETTSNPSIGPDRIFNDGRMAEGQWRPIPLPAVLYHPAILSFAQYCTRPVEAVSEEVWRCALRLRSEITQYGPKENQNMIALSYLFKSLGVGIAAPFSLLRENIKGVDITGWWGSDNMHDVVIANSKREPLVVIKQNGIGADGVADVQGATHVTNCIHLAEKKQLRVHPSEILFNRHARFVIAIEGTTILFFAVSWVGKKANLELLRICSVLFMFEDPDCNGRRHGDLLITLQALRDVLQEGLIEEQFEVIRENLGFPYILHFESPDASCEGVVLDPAVEMQAVGPGGRVVSCLQRQSMKYIATTTKGQKVFVRFGNSYGIDAHKTAAAKGIAPQLLGVTTVHLTENEQGDRYVGVVMEWLDEYKRLGEAFSTSKKDRTEIASRLGKAFDALRDCGVIHGDLQSSNILWRSVDDGTIDVKFVDFEWACLESEPSVYPKMLNDDILWPEGVEPFSTMKAEHDSSFVERICNALIDDNPIDPTERRAISSKRQQVSTAESPTKKVKARSSSSVKGRQCFFSD